MNVATDISLQVVGSVAAALLVAAVVALIATPVVRSLAFKIGAVDVPRDSRRMHDHPIPRMGGLAIFFGFHPQRAALPAPRPPSCGACCWAR